MVSADIKHSHINVGWSFLIYGKFNAALSGKKCVLLSDSRQFGRWTIAG